MSSIARVPLCDAAAFRAPGFLRVFRGSGRFLPGFSKGIILVDDIDINPA